jgi:hypothetical protein
MENWTVEKKDEIEKIFISEISKLGMDIPSNFEDIVQFIYKDVCEVADEKYWHSGDVVIGFRRWIESHPVEEKTYSRKDMEDAFHAGSLLDIPFDKWIKENL